MNHEYLNAAIRFGKKMIETEDLDPVYVTVNYMRERWSRPRGALGKPSRWPSCDIKGTGTPIRTAPTNGSDTFHRIPAWRLAST